MHVSVETPTDASDQLGDGAVRFGGPQELAARGAVLLLAPGRVVIDEALHAETPGPVRVVRVRDHVEVVYDRVVLVGRDGPNRDVAHATSLSHRRDQKR